MHRLDTANATNLCSLYKDEACFPQFKVFMAGLFKKQGELLGWKKREGENENAGSMRAAIFSALGAAGDKQTCSTAANMFEDYYRGGDAIDADLRRIVYKFALKADEAEVMRKLTSAWLASTLSQISTDRSGLTSLVNESCEFGHF